MSEGYLTRITTEDKISFAREYASHDNAFKAALAIGTPPLAAEAVATALLLDNGVSKAVGLYRKWAESQRRATKKTIKDRAAAIINTSMKDFYRTNPKSRHTEFVPPTEWTHEQASAVKKMKFTKKVNPYDGSEEHTFTLELSDPLVAARMMLDFSLEDKEEGPDYESELEALRTVTDEALQYRIRELLG